MIAGAKKFLRPLSLATAVVALTGLCLALPLRSQMNAFAAALILLHIALGLGVAVPIALYLIRLLRESRSRAVALLLVLLSATCLLSGATLLFRPLIGHSNASASGTQWAHLLSGVAAVALGGAFALRLRLPLSGIARGGGVKASASPLLALVGLPFTLWAAADALPYNAENYLRDLSATNPKQAENPLFPAEFRLAEGKSPKEANQRWNGSQPEYCGRAGCHAASVRDWHGSAHALAGRDPYYQKVKQIYANRAEPGATKWCAGCHEPQSALSPPQNASLTLNHGVDCLSCHAVTQTAANTGNARYALSIPESYPFSAEKAGWKRSLHEFLIRLRPAPHQLAFAKPLHKNAELCGNCHRQSYCVAQNQFQFVRGADNFGEWRKSEFSGAIGLGLNEKAAPQKTCLDCHRTGGNVHATPGADAVSALSYRQKGGRDAKKGLHDTENGLSNEPKTLLKDCLEVDIFAIRYARKGASEAWIAPLDAPLQPYSLQEGESAALEIVVHNRGIGHDFPSGYADLKAAWLEVVVRDSDGKIALQNGVPASESDLPPKGARDYRLFALDRAGNPIIRNNRTEQAAILYKRSIPAGGSDLARYSFTLPKSAKFRYPLQISATLRYRPLRPDFEEWVLKGEKGAKPDAIFTLATATAAIHLRGVAAKSPLSPLKNPNSAAVRFARYGSALLAPPDSPELQRAQRAFRIAQSLAPKEAYPYLGLANAYLREPALLDAKREFENALKNAPNSAPARFGLGVVALKQGQFSEALQRLSALVDAYPKDNALFRTLGTAYYQQGDYERAIAAFQSALSIDPDDSKAHFQLKLAYQRQRRLLDAHREGAILQYLAEDRWSATLRREYLRLHPDMQSQARSSPEHSLSPPHQGGAK